MRVQDWFALAVRIVGVALLLIPGLVSLLDSLLLKLGYYSLPDTHASPGYFVIYGIVQVVGGLFLIRGAPSLVEFAYPTRGDDETDTEDDGEPNTWR